MKASEQYLHVVLFIMLYRVVKFVLLCGAEILRCDHFSVCWEQYLRKIIDLIHDTRHLRTRFRNDGIKAMSRVFSWGKQVREFAKARNRGRIYLFWTKENEELFILEMMMAING